MSKNKKVTGYIKLRINAKKATPAPPIGPAFGQKGLNIMEFCKAFNDATKNYEANTPVRVRVTAYADKSHTFELLGSPISHLIKQVIGISKGSTAPGRIKAGNITMEQVRKVAELKLKDGLSARTVESAMKIVAGSARSMGLKVVGAENV